MNENFLNWGERIKFPTRRDSRRRLFLREEKVIGKVSCFREEYNISVNRKSTGSVENVFPVHSFTSNIYLTKMCDYKFKKVFLSCIIWKLKKNIEV